MIKKNIGIIGCGSISHIYITNLSSMFENTNVYAICDLDDSKTKDISEKYGIKKIMTFEEMLKDEKIDLILNLTTPDAHYSICKAALLAGKHTYVEKPLSLTYENANELVLIAASKNLLLGSAPDTFLGAGITKCQQIINEGIIGEPIAATAYMMCHGHESWHPSPDFYYQPGGGPMFDMGPYYLTALINLVGPVKKVMGMTKKSFKKRTITSKEKNGEIIDVNVMTHVNGIMSFENGAIGNIIMSFDVWGHHLPRIEIHGTKGSLQVPDPNTFDGEILLKIGQGDFEKIDYALPYSENSRGVGISELINCIDKEIIPKCDGNKAAHVVELMEGFHKSAIEQKVITVNSTF
ncbi:MAG: Gfo/Idh/MocA family oxidoreductase [Clostridiales bacterium]|nr:Gfo/Idh/MocA family oxidoreductase [Clostridiales bacterium]